MQRTILVTLLSLIVASVQAIPNGAFCDNKATGFFVIDNTALTSVDSIVYKDTAEDDCLRTCSQNRDQYGRSVMCSSFVYDHNSLSCTIYKDKIAPEGQAETTSVVGKRYFEKVCLNDNVPMHCADTQFIRADNAILVGFAYEVSVEKTIEDCVAVCAKNATCKSALYYFEEKECILNSESALTKPDGYQKEESEKVIYFQNGCPEMKNLQIDPTMPTPIEKKDDKKTVEEKPAATSNEEYEDDKEGSAESSVEQTTKATPEVTTTTTEKPASSEEETSKPAEKSTEVAKSEETTSVEKSAEIKPSAEETTVEKSAEQTFIVEKPSKKDNEADYESDEEEEAETTSVEKTTQKPPSTKAPLSTEMSSEEKPEPVQETVTPAKELSTKPTPTFVEQSEYEEEEGEDEDSEEVENLPIKTVDNDKNPAKASYTKYNKHPRNFASKTVVDKSGELQEASAEQTVGTATDAAVSEESSIEQLSGEQGGEPKEAETKPEKKNRKHNKKHHVAVADSEEYIEPKPFPNYFSEWSDWTPCTKSGERQIRRRKCLDLRKCLGALMQVQNCPAVMPSEVPMEHIESVRSIVGASGEEFGLRDVLTQQQARTPAPIVSAGIVDQPPNGRSDEGVWSPWLGTCQQFASGQPCNDGKMIGFESRECVAKDPTFCVGPFFRYCEIAC